MKFQNLSSSQNLLALSCIYDPTPWQFTMTQKAVFEELRLVQVTPILWFHSVNILISYNNIYLRKLLHLAMDLSSVDIKMYSATLKALPQDFFPWFDVCHIILCVLSVRKEASRDFAWRHPFSAWLSCIIASFAGSFICGPLLGK